MIILLQNLYKMRSLYYYYVKNIYAKIFEPHYYTLLIFRIYYFNQCWEGKISSKEVNSMGNLVGAMHRDYTW